MRSVLSAIILSCLPLGAAACGVDTDCTVGDRVYRIAMPEGVTNPGVMVFAHGYRGTARGTMRGGNLRNLAAEHDMALIAVQGVDGNWQLPGTPRTPNMDGEAEYAYFDAVLADAQTRFGIDRDRAVMTGFSAGGMMTWNLICHRSDLFVAFIPMSGTFWTPEPVTCTSPPTNVVHIHGTADSTVPLAGRPIAEQHQGDVLETLATYADFGGYTSPERSTPGDMTCDTQSNADGKILGFCTFDGGHGFGIGRLRAALAMVE